MSPRRSPTAMSIELPEGRLLELAQPVPSGTTAEATAIAVLAPRYFDECPICGGDPTHLEHVPPKSIGGKVMTRTCAACNHDLGSKVEADLVDWYDGALTLPRFESAGVPGARKAARLLIRTTPAGEPVLILDGRADEAIIQMLRGGELDLSGLAPDPNRYLTALLKHAYLAACVAFGIPQGGEAERVRHDLIAARDAHSRAEVPTSPLALGLTVMRHHGGNPAMDATVAHVVVHEDSGPLHGVLLAGRIFVSWSSMLSPRMQRPAPTCVSVPLKVGSPQRGTVTAVTRK